MLRILKYSFIDLIRSRWTIIYCLFYLVLTFALMILSNDLSKVIITLMNIILVLIPLIASMFGVMYYYNSREFTDLLLAQPLRRVDIFMGQYLGVAVSLSLSVMIGLILPFTMYGIFQSGAIWDFWVLIVVSVLLSFIFSAISFLIALKNENRIRGFGLAILSWLFFAVIYDALFLILISVFSDYNLESFTLGATLFNPIDLSRVIILLKLDISALMGYTGAVIRQFLGNFMGMALAILVLVIWIVLPLIAMRWVSLKKDF